MTIFIIILLAIYLVSTLFCWIWIKTAYSTGGVNEGDDVTFLDFLIVIAPVFNTIAALCCWKDEYPKKNHKPNKWWNIIFCINKTNKKD
jgi:hypothetical protein